MWDGGGGGVCQLAPFPSYVETPKFPGPHPVHFPGFSGYFLQREQLGLLARPVLQVCLTSVSEAAQTRMCLHCLLQVFPLAKPLTRNRRNANQNTSPPWSSFLIDAFGGNVMKAKSWKPGSSSNVRWKSTKSIGLRRVQKSLLVLGRRKGVQKVGLYLAKCSVTVPESKPNWGGHSWGRD